MTPQCGAFLFGADRPSLLGPDAENENGSERSERSFLGLTPPNGITESNPSCFAKRMKIKMKGAQRRICLGLSPPAAGGGDHEQTANNPSLLPMLHHFLKDDIIL